MNTIQCPTHMNISFHAANSTETSHREPLPRSDPELQSRRIVPSGHSAGGQTHPSGSQAAAAPGHMNLQKRLNEPRLVQGPVQKGRSAAIWNGLQLKKWHNYSGQVTGTSVNSMSWIMAPPILSLFRYTSVSSNRVIFDVPG